MVAGLVLNIARIPAPKGAPLAGGTSLLKNALVVFRSGKVEIDRQNRQKFLQRHLVKAAARNNAPKKMRLVAGKLNRILCPLGKSPAHNVCRVNALVLQKDALNQKAHAVGVCKISNPRNHRQNRTAFRVNVALEFLRNKGPCIRDSLSLLHGTVEGYNQGNLCSLIVLVIPVFFRQVQKILVASRIFTVKPGRGIKLLCSPVIGGVKSWLYFFWAIKPYRKRRNQKQDYCTNNTNPCAQFYLHIIRIALENIFDN